MSNYKVDLSAINQEDFYVKQNADGCFLIHPRESKHVWLTEERIFRSLMTDSEGTVVSSGFPKFFNYGEDANDDEEFMHAMSNGSVNLTDKADGTLIIASLVNGKAHFRTRGQFDLGDFHDPVMNLIQEKYPNILRFFENLSLYNQYQSSFSYLFEYTGPDNRIVLKYQEPQLVLLGLMDLDFLIPNIDHPTMKERASGFSVPLYDQVPHPNSLTDLLTQFKGLKNTEGVVVRFYSQRNSEPKMIKVKTDWYKRLHAIRFGLNEKKVHLLARSILLQNMEDVERLFYPLGFDFEMIEFIKDDLESYCKLRTEYFDQFKIVTDISENALKKVLRFDDPKNFKKEYVQLVREELGEHAEDFWFHVCMALYDTSPEGYARALRLVDASILGMTANKLSHSLFEAQDFISRIRENDLTTSTCLSIIHH
jgi:hypothetical protein